MSPTTRRVSNPRPIRRLIPIAATIPNPIIPLPSDMPGHPMAVPTVDQHDSVVSALLHMTKSINRGRMYFA